MRGSSTVTRCFTAILFASVAGAAAQAQTTGACCGAQDECAVLTPAQCAFEEGAYQGTGITCKQANCPQRCDPICEYCWEGTPRAGDCDPAWEGDGYCDCGCQFPDSDCEAVGACCPASETTCYMVSEDTCRFEAQGVFHGAGTSCSGVDCNRCDPACAWCWIDTAWEHACSPELFDDGYCDCGCQFPDPDCPAGTCGNGLCEESATSCSADCKDLRAFAAFQNCFFPGQPSPPHCAEHVYAPPAGLDLDDYLVFKSLLSGP